MNAHQRRTQRRKIGRRRLQEFSLAARLGIPAFGSRHLCMYRRAGKKAVESALTGLELDPMTEFFKPIGWIRRYDGRRFVPPNEG